MVRARGFNRYRSNLSSRAIIQSSSDMLLCSMIRKPTFVCANTKNIVSSHSVEQIDKMPPADQDQARNARQQYRAFWPIRRATQRYKLVFRTLPRYREVTVGTGPALASNSK